MSSNQEFNEDQGRELAVANRLMDKNWPEELQAAFWVAVEAPPGTRSTEKVLDLVDVYAKLARQELRSAAVGDIIFFLESLRSWRLHSGELRPTKEVRDRADGETEAFDRAIREIREHFPVPEMTESRAARLILEAGVPAFQVPEMQHLVSRLNVLDRVASRNLAYSRALYQTLQESEGEMRSVKAELRKVKEQLVEARRLHEPALRGAVTFCDACSPRKAGEDGTGREDRYVLVDYPCATIKALDGGE